MRARGLIWAGTRTREFEPMLVSCRDVLGMSPAQIHRNFAALDLPNGDRFEIFGPDSRYNTFMTHPIVGFSTRLNRSPTDLSLNTLGRRFESYWAHLWRIF